MITAACLSGDSSCLLSGQGFWRTKRIPKLGFESIEFSDDPNEDKTGPAGRLNLVILRATALGASFAIKIVERLARLLAHECRSKEAHALPKPTINTHRYTLCKTRSPIPNGSAATWLAVQKAGGTSSPIVKTPSVTGPLVAAAYVTGLQAEGITTSPKHFVGNEG